MEEHRKCHHGIALPIPIFKAQRSSISKQILQEIGWAALLLMLTPPTSPDNDFPNVASIHGRVEKWSP